MGEATQFLPEKLVMAVLISRPEREQELLGILERTWGQPDLCSQPVPFTYTDYYDNEMGPGIQRFFVSFRRLVDPSLIADIKLASNRIEEQFREGDSRKVNIDPGLLCLSRFILVTTKESAHRIPLSGGIYAEVTLLFHKGSFRPLEWTYPDYRSPEYLRVLNDIRGLYKAQTHAHS
ncbi:MAG TPA: DUF4416 family protein [Spirochaetia bacterium]|nr:DUF4416 family protein [Spirochaetia bacterium]